MAAMGAGSTVFASQLTALLTLGLCREQALLQIPNLCLRERQVGKQLCLRMGCLRFELTHDTLVPTLPPLRAPKRLGVQDLPSLGVCLELDMLLLGDRHKHAGKRCHARIHGRSDTLLRLNRWRTHGRNGKGKTELCPAILEESTASTGSPNIYNSGGLDAMRSSQECSIRCPVVK